ncbi:MAG: S8 family serine peptidase [Candidatus Odinarchaeota archaeon]
MTSNKVLNREIIVKFCEGGMISEREGRLYADHLKLEGFYKILSTVKGAIIFLSFPFKPDRLEEMKIRAKKSLKREIPNLNLFVRIKLTEKVDIDSLIKNLNDDPEVEYACLAGIPSPPPATPDFTGMQIYMDPAPDGVNARYAWNYPGGDGTGVKVCDCEYGFNDNHEDLPNVNIISNREGDISQWREHGTNTLGVIAAINDSKGVTGISHQATILFASESGGNRTLCITDAIENLNEGDVLVLEMQTEEKPAEYDLDIHTAILMATGNGITVVEAAGNEGSNLAEISNEIGKYIWNIRSNEYDDSMAIIVGAGFSGSIVLTTPCSKIFSSNYGDRVDCQAWGDSVVTTGDGDLYNGGPNENYTDSFSATSSATAIIAGVVACIQGVAKRAMGIALTPTDIRNLLKDPANGTPQQSSFTFPAASHHIGPMPDLEKILNAIYIFADVYMRDNLADTGIEPSTGPILYRSPDIIPRNNEVNDPLAEFGPASWENEYLGENIIHGQDNFIYIRLNNRGNAPDSVNVSLYWAKSSTFIHPSDWTLINTISVNNIQPGELRVVDRSIIWQSNQIPRPGNYCLIAVVNSVRDPLEIPNEFASAGEYFDFIRNNNNICFRNISIVELVPGQPSRYRFIMRGIPQRAARFRLEVRNQLPEDTNIVIEVAKNIPRFINLYIKNKKPDTLKIPFKLKERCPLILDNIILGRDEKLPIEIMVNLPNKVRSGVYTIYADQYLDKNHLGRVNFIIRIKK